jgi:hypothetical protein
MTTKVEKLQTMSPTASKPVEGTAKLVFGVVFDLNGTHVPVSTKDIANAKANGIEFSLPQEGIKLGSMTDFEQWFKKQFNLDLPKKEDLPPPLDSIFGKLSNLQVTVHKLYIKIPGTNTPGAPKLYTVELSAAWPEGQGIELIPKVLTIEGVVFGATNQ